MLLLKELSLEDINLDSHMKGVGTGEVSDYLFD